MEKKLTPQELYEAIEKAQREKAIGRIQELLRELPDDGARKEAISELCLYCGCLNPQCTCMRDD